MSIQSKSKRKTPQSKEVKTDEVLHFETQRVIQKAQAVGKPMQEAMMAASAAMQQCLEVGGQIDTLSKNFSTVQRLISADYRARHKDFDGKPLTQALALVIQPVTKEERRFVSKIAKIAAGHLGQGESCAAAARKTVEATILRCYSDNTKRQPVLSLVQPVGSIEDDKDEVTELIPLKATRKRMRKLKQDLSMSPPKKRYLRVTLTDGIIGLDKIYASTRHMEGKDHLSKR